MSSEQNNQHYPVIIVGAGLAGASAFYHLSKFTEVLLIEKRAKFFETPYKKVRVICAHTNQWIPDVLNLNDEDIFPKEVKQVQYSSRNLSANLKPWEEINKNIGNNMDEGKAVVRLLKEGLKGNGKIMWETNVSEIPKAEKMNDGEDSKDDYMRIKTPKGEFMTDLLVLATGSHSFQFNKNLGFHTPRTYNAVSAKFEIPEEYIDDDVPMEYMFHRHPKISEIGPLAMIKADNYINLHYVSRESSDVMKEKMLRILRNYDHISPFFRHATPQPAKMSEQDLSLYTASKSAIPEFVDDHVVLIGEAAGLVSEYYFEGTLGAFASSHYLAKFLKELQESGKTGRKENLRPYEKLVKKNILSNWEKSQKANEELFYEAGENQFVIWDAYVKAMRKHRKVRENIYYAWYHPDLEHYPLKNDEYCGEKIYMNLPLSRKVSLAPFFLKLKFS